MTAEWKRARTRRSVQTDVEVSLDEFSRAELLQALIDDGCISQAEAQKLLDRKNEAERAIEEDDRRVIFEEIDFARMEAASGRRDEALIHLERALGCPFIGVLR
jgi:hypothetical protein